MMLKSVCLSAAVAIGVLGAGVASATLGEPESAIVAETQFGRASIKQANLGVYRVHEMQMPSGTVLREYSGLDGKVFAVTWHGPFIPNLRQTLGRYFDEFAAQAQAQGQAGAAPGKRKHLVVRQAELVVESGGHMRAHHGRAYLPPAIPSGVSIGDLQ